MRWKRNLMTWKMRCPDVPPVSGVVLQCFTFVSGAGFGPESTLQNGEDPCPSSGSGGILACEASFRKISRGLGDFHSFFQVTQRSYLLVVAMAHHSSWAMLSDLASWMKFAWNHGITNWRTVFDGCDSPCFFPEVVPGCEAGLLPPFQIDVWPPIHLQWGSTSFVSTMFTIQNYTEQCAMKYVYIFYIYHTLLILTLQVFWRLEVHRQLCEKTGLRLLVF